MEQIAPLDFTKHLSTGDVVVVASPDVKIPFIGVVKRINADVRAECIVNKLHLSPADGRPFQEYCVTGAGEEDNRDVRISQRNPEDMGGDWSGSGYSVSHIRLAKGHPEPISESSGKRCGMGWR